MATPEKDERPARSRRPPVRLGDSPVHETNTAGSADTPRGDASAAAEASRPLPRRRGSEETDIATMMARQFSPRPGSARSPVPRSNILSAFRAGGGSGRATPTSASAGQQQALADASTMRSATRLLQLAMTASPRSTKSVASPRGRRSASKAKSSASRILSAREQRKFLSVLGRRVAVTSDISGCSLYHLARLWVTGEAATDAHSDADPASRPPSPLPSLPAPKPHTEMSLSRLLPQRRDGDDSTADTESLFAESFAESEREAQLQKHVAYLKSIRKWHQVQFSHRIARYRDRLHQVCPPVLYALDPSLSYANAVGTTAVIPAGADVTEASAAAPTGSNEQVQTPVSARSAPAAVPMEADAV